MNSHREDGRGHWTPGKRRHPDVVSWSRVRLRLQALLDRHHRHLAISRAQLARDVGVSDKSVRRWLAGTDRPAPELQECIAQWVAERREELTASRS